MNFEVICQRWDMFYLECPLLCPFVLCGVPLHFTIKLDFSAMEWRNLKSEIYINFQNFWTFNFRTFNFRTKIFGGNYYRFRTISDKISDIFKQVNKISDIYDLIMSRQIIHQI